MGWENSATFPCVLSLQCPGCQDLVTFECDDPKVVTYMITVCKKCLAFLRVNYQMKYALMTPTELTDLPVDTFEDLMHMRRLLIKWQKDYYAQTAIRNT